MPDFNQKPATLLRIGTIIAVAGGLLALICLIIFAQPVRSQEDLWTYVLIPPFLLGCFVLLAGLAVVLLHFVVKLLGK